MITSLCGTPGTGKTTICTELKSRGYRAVSLNDHLRLSGRFETETVAGELIVDVENVKELLIDDFIGVEEDVIIDGHLSYLAPWDLCIVLRLHPADLRTRLEERGYSSSKVQENVEAEIVSSVLVDALNEKELRSKGILIEMDCTGLDPDECTEKIEKCILSMRAKRLNDLHQYLPGRVDWLEVIGEWC